jgi:hypothetical protein
LDKSALLKNCYMLIISVTVFSFISGKSMAVFTMHHKVSIGPASVANYRDIKSIDIRGALPNMASAASHFATLRLSTS